MNVRDRRFIEQVAEALLVLARLPLGVPAAQVSSGLRREGLEDQQLIRTKGHRHRITRVQVPEYRAVLRFQRRADIAVDAERSACRKELGETTGIVV